MSETIITDDHTFIDQSHTFKDPSTDDHTFIDHIYTNLYQNHKWYWYQGRRNDKKAKGGKRTPKGTSIGPGEDKNLQ